MIDIDRRRLLRSLAATTVCAPVVSTINAADASVRRGTIHEVGQSFEGWLLARESRQLTDHAVDFWARPWSDVPYTKHLPREIARGAMWYEPFGRPNCRTPEEIDKSLKHYCFGWSETPRRYAACSNNFNNVSSTLKSLIGNDASNSTSRTALLSLDSSGPMREPNWATALPAFRSCYDRIIGHFHLPQRGLRQWRKFLNGHLHSKSGRGYFQEFFADAAAQCDAVILTSSALCERDFRCCLYASTEELVGKLMRRLGCALLAPAVLERVAGAGEAGTLRKPRFFALASLGLWTTDDYFLAYANALGWQSELVYSSFGDAIPSERPLLVAAAVANLQSDLVDEFRRVAGGSFFTTTTPAYEYEVEKLGHPSLNDMKMITLWPFEFDEKKLRSA